MKLYVYAPSMGSTRNTLGIVDISRKELMEAPEYFLGTIEATGPGEHKASEVEWSNQNIEYKRLSNQDINTYNCGFRAAEKIFAPAKLKTVVREAKQAHLVSARELSNMKTVTFAVPHESTNHKFTYEVSE